MDLTILYFILAFFLGFSVGGFLEYWADYTDWESLLKEYRSSSGAPDA